MRELEAKVKDQEEELDEQAGTIQMLEQVGGAAQPPDLQLNPGTGSVPGREVLKPLILRDSVRRRSSNELFLQRQRDVRVV